MVLVGLANLLDQAVNPQSFQDSGQFIPALLREILLERLVIEPGNLMFATGQELKQVQIGGGEEVEPGKRSVFDGYRSGHLFQFTETITRIIQGREELQVAPVGGFQHRLERRQAVDALLHRRVLHD